MCPECGNELTYTWKSSYKKACKRNQVCMSCRPTHWSGRKHTDSTKNKISKANAGRSTNKGVKFSEEHKRKISKANMGNKSRTGMPHSEKTKKKMRLAWKDKIHPNSKPENREKFRKLYQDRVKSRCGQITPNYNVDACRVFDEINKELGWSGQHAENGGEVNVRGWFLDYYEPNQNVVIEYDESHHLRTRRKEKDIRKELEVIEMLNCKFYRIQEGQNWRDVISKSTDQNIAEWTQKFIATQYPLPPEEAKVLYDNLSNLYIK